MQFHDVFFGPGDNLTVVSEGKNHLLIVILCIAAFIALGTLFEKSKISVFQNNSIEIKLLLSFRSLIGCTECYRQICAVI